MTATQDETYNGYTNYETWAVELWIDNDQGSQEYWLENAKLLDAYHLAGALKEMHEEMADESCNHIISQASIFSDLMSHALARVNWLEIAENLIEAASDAT